MEAWRIALLLMLLTSTAYAKESVLVAGKDELIWSVNEQVDSFDTPTEIKEAPEKAINALSMQAAEALIELVNEHGNISGEPIPIYRDDLASNYVAYWMVELNSSQYVTVASSRLTADYTVPIHGPLPSPITDLDLTAEGYGKECAAYLMMTPGGAMMCRDAMGNIVATTVEELILSGNMSDDDPNFEHAHEYIYQNIAQLAFEWAVRAAEVAKKSIWDDDTQVVSSTDTNEVTSYTQGYVKPGDVIKVFVDKDTVSVKVKYTSESEAQTQNHVELMQLALCQMFSNCDVDDDSSISMLQQTSMLHLNYVEVDISKDIPGALNGSQSIDFELLVENTSGEVSVKYYSLDTTSHRQKRFTQASYSGWITTSIPDEQYFPFYWQHKVSRGCWVGCGPVAWAMVFGYLDRRSHFLTSKYGVGSQSLYRDGSDGTTGSTIEFAPTYSVTIFPENDARLKKYIERLARELDTWCIFENGATHSYKMDRIQGFFQRMQKSGNPTIQRKYNVWKVIKRESLASYTRAAIRAGWPVVVGTYEGSIFKWHYPVATKYISQTHRWRRCVKIFRRTYCLRWRSETMYKMYTHQGQANPKVSWRAMDIHYAAYAKY